jgi:hypothetical protein
MQANLSLNMENFAYFEIIPPNSPPLNTFQRVFDPLSASCPPEVGPPIERAVAMDGQDQPVDQAINSYHRHSLSLFGDETPPPPGLGGGGVRRVDQPVRQPLRRWSLPPSGGSVPRPACGTGARGRSYAAPGPFPPGSTPPAGPGRSDTATAPG